MGEWVGAVIYLRAAVGELAIVPIRGLAHSEGIKELLQHDLGHADSLGLLHHAALAPKRTVLAVQSDKVTEQEEAVVRGRVQGRVSE